MMKIPAAALVVMLILCHSKEGGSVDYKLASHVGRVFLSNRMNTFINTEADVSHMELDLMDDGSIMFSDGAALKVTDGSKITLLAGDALTPGYQEGSAKVARFGEITGFHQISNHEVVIADKYNHCLRKLNRHTGVITTFAGKCGTLGFKDGVDSIFYHPNGVYGVFGQYINETIREMHNKDKNLKNNLNTFYVTDQGNMAVRRIETDGQVVTLLKDNQLQGVSFLFTGSSYGPSGVMSFTDHGFINDRGSQIGPLLGNIKPKKMLMFTEQNGTGLVNEKTKFAVISDTNQLNFFDARGTKLLLKACSRKKGSADGDLKTCQLDKPQSLLAYELSLLIGQYRSIRIIPAPGSRYDLPTDQLTTKSPQCDSSNITAHIRPNETAVAVKVALSVTLQLAIGDHVYNDEITNCTVNIHVVKTEERISCPNQLIASTSPLNGLATFTVKVGSRNHTLRLPLGRYPYAVAEGNQTCNLTLVAEDYRIQNVLELTADYDVDCKVINNTMSTSLLKTIANERYKVVEEICQNDCGRPGLSVSPKLSCGDDNKLNIRWPTDAIFRAGNVVPAQLLSKLRQRIVTKGSILDIVVIAHRPPVVYPKKAVDGGSARVILTTGCMNNLMYSAKDQKCI